ncbi:MAG: hypothetical protein Q8P68_00165 [Candidatus Peregrinibacteria bacterium]|nr:hypothetical protein [Candidatus Peregrinibacteria bacterium]MDZ4244613.1 hypothetical protein [Candidatus Gracilibacteria bacterium]
MAKILSAKIRGLIGFFGINFLLHLIWENAQAPLFVGHESFWQHFPPCFFATATGDMIFTLIIYIVLALINKNFWWIFSKKAYKNPYTWIAAIAVGILLAVLFELWAVYIDFRWIYGAMPIIPIIHVGLTPVLQMVFIPILSIKIFEMKLLRISK